MSNLKIDLTKLSDAEIIDNILGAESDKKSADSALKKLKNELLTRKESDLKALYGAKDEPYGIVNLQIGDSLVKVDTTKKVEWDQGKLEELFKQITADGADPKQYIKVEYAVSETAYKSWADNLKAYFSPARTVKTGNPTIKIEGDKE